MDDIGLEVLHLPVNSWAQSKRQRNSLVPREGETAKQHRCSRLMNDISACVRIAQTSRNKVKQNFSERLLTKLKATKPKMQTPKEDVYLHDPMTFAP